MQLINGLNGSLLHYLECDSNWDRRISDYRGNEDTSTSQTSNSLFQVRSSCLGCFIQVGECGSVMNMAGDYNLVASSSYSSEMSKQNILDHQNNYFKNRGESVLPFQCKSPDVDWQNKVALREPLKPSKTEDQRGGASFLGWLRHLLTLQSCRHTAIRKLTLAQTGCMSQGD